MYALPVIDYSAAHVALCTKQQALKYAKDAIDYAVSHGNYRTPIRTGHPLSYDFVEAYMREQGYKIECTDRLNGSFVVRWD